MNKNSNVYIIIYASVMIIIVAVLLSVASMALKSRQQANIAVEKQGAILSTIGLGGDADKVKDKTKYIEQEYEKYITDSYVVNGEGDRVEGAAAFGLLDNVDYARWIFLAVTAVFVVVIAVLLVNGDSVALTKYAEGQFRADCKLLPGENRIEARCGELRDSVALRVGTALKARDFEALRKTKGLRSKD